MAELITRVTLFVPGVPASAASQLDDLPTEWVANDGQFGDAFALGIVADDVVRRIDASPGALVVSWPVDLLAGREQIVAAVRQLRDAGGLGVRIEESKLSWDIDTWLELFSSDDPWAWHRGAVVFLRSDSVLQSIGMHAFSLPDTRIELGGGRCPTHSGAGRVDPRQRRLHHDVRPRLPAPGTRPRLRRPRPRAGLAAMASSSTDVISAKASERAAASNSRFAPGSDARVVSALLRRRRGQGTFRYISAVPWVVYRAGVPEPGWEVGQIDACGTSARFQGPFYRSGVPERRRPGAAAVSSEARDAAPTPRASKIPRSVATVTPSDVGLLRSPSMGLFCQLLKTPTGGRPQAS